LCPYIVAAADIKVYSDIRDGELVWPVVEKGENMLISIFISIYRFANDIDKGFDMWCGGFSEPNDGVGALVCVALNGYHSISTYQWYNEGEEMRNETYPSLYVIRPGKYWCVVTFTDCTKRSKDFIVTGYLICLLCAQIQYEL